jgi:hypothetical protein
MKNQPTAVAAGLARRTFLAGLAVIVPIGATAATAAQAGSKAQSEIDTLIAHRDRSRHLDGLTSGLADRLGELEGAYFAAIRVAPPELAIRKADFRLLKEFGGVSRWQYQTHFLANDIRRMRGRKAMRYFSRFVAPGTPAKDLAAAPEVEPIGKLGLDYDEHYGRKPWPLAQKRKDDLVANFDRWEANKVALRESMGVDDAEETLEAHQDEADDAVKAIVDSPATTVQALQFKASLMAEWTDDEEPFDNWRTVDLMTAVLEDIAKLSISVV